MPKVLLLLLALGSLTAAEAQVAPQPLPACHLRILRDYTLGVTYKAVLRLSPGCRPGTVLRVRKSSTLNTRRGGAPYQPIKPEAGAWELSASKTTIPARELWTLYSWRWEFYDPAGINPLTGKPGRWRGAGVQ